MSESMRAECNRSATRRTAAQTARDNAHARVIQSGGPGAKLPVHLLQASLLPLFINRVRSPDEEMQSSLAHANAVAAVERARLPRFEVDNIIDYRAVDSGD